MRFLDSIRRSGRNLRHAKLRTALTMLAISIGAFALMLTLAAGEGARHFVDRLVGTNFNPQSIYVFKESENTDNPFSQDDDPKEYDGTSSATENAQDAAQVALHKSDIEKIAKIPQVERVAPLLQINTDYVTAAGAKKFQSQVKSVDEGVQYEAIAGKIPATLPKDQAILPETLVSALGFEDAGDAIGKEIIVHYTASPVSKVAEGHYKVAAVAKKPNGLLGGAREIILAQATLESVYEAQRGGLDTSYFGAIAIAKDSNPATLSQIQSHLRYEKLQSMSAKDLATQVTQAVNIVQYFVAGFGVIALIVSVFGIVNTQLISVLERTRQIGLMKALGMSGLGVLRLFTFEAIWIGFGGALIGVFWAYFASIFANPFINDKLELGGNLLLFRPVHIALLVGGLMLIAAVAGLLPAWKAARLNPIEALRTE